MEKPSGYQPEAEKNYLYIDSKLKNISGTKETFRILVNGNNTAKALAFFDIDGTLAELKFIHGLAIQRMFPHVDPCEITQSHFAAFKLGSSYRGFDRLLGIYRDGHESWQDPEFYIRERFKPYEREIETPGFRAHDIAEDYTVRYGHIAAGIAKQIYEQEPEKFEEAKIKPIYQMARLFKKQGIPMVGMTANGHDFAHDVTRYLGLSSLFLDLATDETMNGGGKELSMGYLIKELEKKGLNIPTDKLLVVGDSLIGDIGSNSRFSAQNGKHKNKGILVMEDNDSYNALQQQVERDPALKDIFSTTDTVVFITGNALLNHRGMPKLGSRYRNMFLRVPR